MRRYMIVLTPMQTGYGGIRRVKVSLPLIPCLLGEKYMLPHDVPPPQTRDLRRMRRAKPRAPSLRSLVRLAMQCDSAEQLGKQLRRRFRRIENGRAAAETEAKLDRLLAQD